MGDTLVTGDALVTRSTNPSHTARAGEKLENGGHNASSRHPSVPRLALSPDEAAHALGVSRDYLDQHITPELRWIRRGRRKFVSVTELEAWLERAAARTVDVERYR
jgi:hypothetical protein